MAPRFFDRELHTGTWTIQILPFMDQGPLFRNFNANEGIGSAANQAVMSTELSAFKCPSDPFSDTPFAADSSAGSQGAGVGARYDGLVGGRGCYGINVNPGSTVPGATPTLSNERLDDRTISRGIAGANISFRFRDLTDGTSNTIAVDEIRAGVNSAQDARGVWGMPTVGSSLAVWQAAGDAFAPNACDPHADDLEDIDPNNDICMGGTKTGILETYRFLLAVCTQAVSKSHFAMALCGSSAKISTQEFGMPVTPRQAEKSQRSLSSNRAKHT